MFDAKPADPPETMEGTGNVSYRRMLVTVVMGITVCSSCRKAETPSAQANTQPPVQAAGQPSAPGADPALAAAMKSVSSWLALVDQGKYGESWEAAAEIFRNGVAREKWIDAVGATRGPFGKLVSRTPKSSEPKTSLPGAPDGNYLVMQFDTSFEHKQAAVETVTAKHEADATWKVAGYFVR